MKVIDYDRIEEWELWIDRILFRIIPNKLVDAIAQSNPEYIDDAAEILYQYGDRNELIENLRVNLNTFYVRVYHGTRLSLSELADIKENGLRPLLLTERKNTLIEIFKGHPEWETVQSNLDGILTELGPGQRVGRREDGKIHVCFSRKGLLEGCSHYLTHGAEVDGHVASMMFEDLESALQLLKVNRKPYLISFLADFESALSAANPFGFNSEDIPSLLKLIIEPWAYRKYKVDFSSGNLRNDAAAMFHGPKLAHELDNIEEVSENSIISR